jgi:hypothetical protein
LDNFVDTEVGAILAAVDTEVASIKTVTDAMPYKKNTALGNFEFIMTDSTTHAPKTGIVNGSFTKQESIDGGAFAGLGGTITEVANGVYKINFSTGEMNGDVITFRFAAAGADDTMFTIKTHL